MVDANLPFLAKFYVLEILKIKQKFFFKYFQQLFILNKTDKKN